MADEDSFDELIGGEKITPVKAEPRVFIQPLKADPRTLEERRLAAAAEPPVVDDPLAGAPPTLLGPLDLMSFKRPGVQNGVFRNLRLGKYPVDARLDLHGLSADRARHEVYQFIKDCMASDVRVALVTHGKAEGREQPAILKSHVAHWLTQLHEVLAYHSAQRHHGGYGATYVLMKKSDRKKQETREKHSRKDV